MTDDGLSVSSGGTVYRTCLNTRQGALKRTRAKVNGSRSVSFTYYSACWTAVSSLFGSALGPLFLFLALVLLVGARLFLRVLAALLALSLVLTRFFLTT